MLDSSMHRMSTGFLHLALLILLASGTRGIARADTGFRTPSPELVAIADMPRSSQVRISPDGTHFLLLERSSAEALAELDRPERPLAGLRLDPGRSGPSRFTAYVGFRLVELATGDTLHCDTLPEGLILGYSAWAPDGSRVALGVVGSEGWRLWILECDTGKLVSLQEPRLNACFGTPFHWMPDSRGLALRTVIPGSDSVPPPLPLAPRVEENTGQKAPARTWQDLLETAEDDALFSRLCRSRVALLEWDDTGRSSLRELRELEGVFTDLTPSPDGRMLLVEELREPWSRLLPWYRFPTRISVHDLQGKLLHTVVDRPLADRIPITRGSCVTGPRDVSWRADSDASLVWFETLDGGDPGQAATPRDQAFMQAAPFKDSPVLLHTSELRLSSIQWAHDDLALVWSWWWPTRTMRCERIAPARPDTRSVLVSERNWQDRYSDPGRPISRIDSRGQSVLQLDASGDSLYYTGSGASAEGEHPFLDAVAIADGGSRRLFQSAPGGYDSVVDYEPVTGRLLLSREDRRTPSNLWTRDLITGAERQLTRAPNPHPWLNEASSEVIHYTRADGVALHGTLWLPPGWTPDQGPLPTLLWAYPGEFRSADAAGQVSGSGDRFERLSWASAVIWLLKGYAVLDDPAMPIIGEDDESPNDTFVSQLVADAQAAVDALVARGVCDPARVAVGGHSYGAFMTANLLAHSRIFAAGLARSGAYNRTLTPFGFQSEDRNFWEAPEVYMAMSPLAHADTILDPLLLVHGERDSNPGTHLLQSERMFEAIKGLGGTARLCVLPWESHSYRARENILHLLWETETWLDRHVTRAPEPVEDTSGN
ncbi:MAG: S9 family peptidase [Candidatus Cloacimonetes bacterium]|nr:S9 family peptidase [Candidatus Cloacimonadota bacterium]